MLIFIRSTGSIQPCFQSISCMSAIQCIQRNMSTKKGLAVVTGASRGIGLAVAHQFIQAGIPTVLVSRNLPVLEHIRSQLIQTSGSSLLPDIHIRMTDVSDASQVDLLCKELSSLGHIQYLVNSAGVSLNSLLITTTLNQIETTIHTNLMGTIFMCKGVLRNMVKYRSGSIVNVASVVGVNTASAGASIYAASKAGVVGFTKSMAAEVGAKGIYVNAIAPGFIETDMTADISTQKRQDILNKIPLGRFGTADEVAKGVFYLARASFTTGQCLVMDGGQTA
ncbi:hypothetical protein RTP6_006322 [Batrachochytrium dendrobatidis]